MRPHSFDTLGSGHARLGLDGNLMMQVLASKGGLRQPSRVPEGDFCVPKDFDWKILVSHSQFFDIRFTGNNT